MKDIREHLALLTEKSKPKKLIQLDLPVSYQEIDRVLSTHNVKFHYEVLAKGYVSRYNSDEGDAKFNQAGAELHNLWFSQFTKPRAGNSPTGPVGDLIKDKFGSWNKCIKSLEAAAKNLQGSGWIYIDPNGDIGGIHNHEMGHEILLLIDLWEHAYQSDYGADRDEYIENFLGLVDWGIINQRMISFQVKNS